MNVTENISIFTSSMQLTLEVSSVDSNDTYLYLRFSDTHSDVYFGA